MEEPSHELEGRQVVLRLTKKDSVNGLNAFPRIPLQINLNLIQKIRESLKFQRDDHILL